MSPRKADPPVFLIIGGPNGSGKSSLYQDVDIEAYGRSVWIINPDLLAARISDIEKVPLADANLEAVVRIEEWLETSIAAHQTVGVETVLSTGKYRRLVQRAKEIGFEFRFIYVVLDSVERNVERVKLRVKKGGHTVPEQSILDRHPRSLDQMRWFFDQADKAWVFENSGSQPKLVVEKDGGVIAMVEKTLPVIARSVREIAASGEARSDDLRTTT